MTSHRHAKRHLGLAAICALVFIVVHATPMVGEKKDAAGAAKTVEAATKKGFPLRSSSTDVTGNISVEATLIPAKIAKSVFSKEVAENYAVIVLTISNRSSDDSFIVHTIFIDYSRWLLSGSSLYSRENDALCTEPEADAADNAANKADAGGGEGGGQGKEKKARPCNGNILRPWQQQTFANQIDSVETRIVRGELLDRQPWTTRNWVLRLLEGVGSVAAGFTFATVNDDWIRGIGAYNGHFISAAEKFWPDGTVGQMNRISDYGFQVNKAIGKQSSDIVVAFFPIDRFLSPGLREVFLKAPSIFFSPYAMLMDPKRPKQIDEIVAPMLGITIQQIRAKDATSDAANPKFAFMNHIPDIADGACDPQVGQPASSAGPETPELTRVCRIARLLEHASLNTVHVIVGGTMTVDVNKVPSQISEVQIDPGADGNVEWQSGTAMTGVIRGSFLGGATPTITNVDSKLFEVKADSQGSSDTQLHFTITPKGALPEGTTKLTFQVSKQSDGATIKSATHDYTIPTASQDAKKADGNGK